MSGFDPNGPAAADAGVFGLPHGPDDAELVLVPVPFDVTTSYRDGARRGPDGVRAASLQVDLEDRRAGQSWRRGIHLLEVDPRVVAWNETGRQAVAADRDAATTRTTVDALGAELNDWLEETTRAWRRRDKLVGVVGGDHAVPFGALRAVAADGELGILHVDAHADLRDAYEGFRWSHASILANVLRELPGVTRVAQVGIRDFCREELDAIERSEGRVRTWFWADWHRRLARGETTLAAACREVVEVLPSRVWISFDIDGLEPTLCPNTGTPVPGGLAFDDAALLVETLRESGREIVGFDLCEVAPPPPPPTPPPPTPRSESGDGADDSWDAIVGARVLFMLCGQALLGR